MSHPPSHFQPSLKKERSKVCTPTSDYISNCMLKTKPKCEVCGETLNYDNYKVKGQVKKTEHLPTMSKLR